MEKQDTGGKIAQVPVVETNQPCTSHKDSGKEGNIKIITENPYAKLCVFLVSIEELLAIL